MRNAALDSIEIQSILGEHTEEAAYLVDADDPTQPIITCNKALCRLYGFAPDSLCGKSWRHLHLGPQNDAKQIKLVDETSQAIHDNHPRVLTLVGYHQDGQKLLTRLRLIKLDPARSGMSHNRHFMGIIETDVSELFHINQLAYEQGRLLSVRSSILPIISGQTDANTLYRRVCEVIMQHIPEFHVFVARTEPLTVITSETANIDPSPFLKHIGMEDSCISNAISICLSRNEMRLIEDLPQASHSQEERRWSERQGIASMLTFALSYGRRHAAALVLLAPQPDHFDKKILAFYKEIARTIDLGMEALEREHELRLTRDFYAAASEINQLIIRRPDPEILFSGICNLILNHAGMDAVWVGLLQPDLSLKVVSSATAKDLDFDPYKLDLSADKNKPSGHGAAGLAIQTGQMQVVEDLSLDDHFNHWRTIHNRSNLRAVAAFPFRRGNNIFGVVSVSSRQSGLFSEPLVNLLQNLANNITFGLDDYDRGCHLEFLALHDPMTGLHNRSVFQDRLQQMLRKNYQQSSIQAIALLDLDGFKDINDQYGHAAGDMLLTSIARHIAPCLRKEDTLARLGGDEFGLLLPNIRDSSTLKGILEHILDTMKLPVPLPDGSSQSIGASIGVAIASPQLTPEDLLKRADYALYQVKNQGGGHYAFFDRKLESEIQARNHVRQNFSQALQTGQILLRYQPEVNLLDNQVHGAEVLVYWEDNGKLVHPDKFISEVASDVDLSRELGHNILMRAAEQIDIWHHQYGLDLNLNVNINLKHLASGHFTRDIDEIIAYYPKTPDHLSIEIGEFEVLNNPERISQHIKWAAKRGIHVYLDNLSNTPTAMDWLQTLPIAGIKLDAQFVRGILNNPHNLSIAISMSVMALLDGLKLTAVGIENRAERDMLLDLGIRSGQGHFFSPALPIDEFNAWLKTHKPCPGTDSKIIYESQFGLQPMISQIAAIVHLFELALEQQPVPPILGKVFSPGKIPLYKWLEDQALLGMEPAIYNSISSILNKLVNYAVESLHIWQKNPSGLDDERVGELKNLLAQLRYQAYRQMQN